MSPRHNLSGRLARRPLVRFSAPVCVVKTFLQQM